MIFFLTKQFNAIFLLCIGGERFYTSLLKAVGAVMMEAPVSGCGSFANYKDPSRNFLHAVFNNHANMVTRYAEMRRHGLTLNFTQAPKGRERESACDIAKSVMEQNEDIFRITVDRLEFGFFLCFLSPNGIFSIDGDFRCD